MLIFVFPDAEQKERNYCGSRPKLGAARRFGFRLPAKQLRGNQESDYGAANHRSKVQTKFRDLHRISHGHGLLQAADQVGCWEKVRNLLNELWQNRKRNRHAGKEQESEPDNLV